jgi:ribose transport system permease protein
MKLFDEQAVAAMDPPRAESDEATSGNPLVRFAQGRFSDLWIVGVLAILVVVFGVLGQGFISQAGWLATSQYAVITLLLGIGQTFVIISGGIDLSVGAVLGVSAMGSAWVMQDLGSHGTSSTVTVIVGVMCVLALGAGTGLVNGLLVTKARLTPFIATLATLSVYEGAQSLISNGTDITNVPNWMGTIGATSIGGWLPVLVLIAVVLALGAAWYLHQSRFGMRTYAIGSNREAAERSGIRVDRHLVWVYVISGVLAAIAGWCYLARFTDASPVAGQGDELGAIAAVVIGGASLMGGKGSMLGTVVGTLIISVLVTGLITMNVPTFWQEVAVGVILAAAVYADQIRERLTQQ